MQHGGKRDALPISILQRMHICTLYLTCLKVGMCGTLQCSVLVRVCTMRTLDEPTTCKAHGALLMELQHKTATNALSYAAGTFSGRRGTQAPGGNSSMSLGDGSEGAVRRKASFSGITSQQPPGGKSSISFGWSGDSSILARAPAPASRQVRESQAGMHGVSPSDDHDASLKKACYMVHGTRREALVSLHLNVSPEITLVQNLDMH
jgi:hypothetical protein